MKIEILITDASHPINPYLKQLESNLELDHSVSIVRSAEHLTSGDLLFLISCSELVDSKVTDHFKHAMVIHASDLPKGRGWSPHIWELLSGADKITVSLLDADPDIDCGDVYKKITVEIPQSALWDEINGLLFSAEIQLIEFAIDNYDDLQSQPQSLDIDATYYPKRKPEHSEIDPNKSISEQFDLIRVCDPNRYPAFIKHRGETYKIMVEKLCND